jgi:hypothetical protein
MPEYSPPSADDGIDYIFMGLIYLVYIQIEIIVDDVSCGCYQHRGYY